MAAYALPGILVMGCLVCLMESYVIRCPKQSEWNIRAEIQCQNITKYFCLYNYIHYTYEEGCTGPEWDIPGSKRVYSSNFNAAPCRDAHYQPIRFVTNGNSDCIFWKSLCTEEGQTLLSNGTTRTDSTCRCDYTQGYAFVTVPRGKCYCRPSEEDCSCYLKKCPGVGYNLSADYECTENGTKKTVCSLMSENPSEYPHIDMAPTGTQREYDSNAIKRTYDVAILVSICLFVMIVITVITVYIMLRQRLPRCTCLSTEQTSNAESKRMDTGPSMDTIEQNGSNHESDGNVLEKIVSGNNEDPQIALSESDENHKSAVEKFKDSIKKQEPVIVFKHLNEVVDNCIEPVKLAVTGKSGVGKSSFINAIRDMKPGDPGFATLSSSGNATKHVTVYEYPGNPMITLHDLPGFGTIKLPTNEYEKTMELHKYDYILIFVGNIEENDIEIAKRLKEMKKPFCFVRSKIDIDIQNAQNDGESKTDAVWKISSKISDNLEHEGFNKANFFVISNHNRRLYQFNDLVSYIQSNLFSLKCDAVMFSKLGELSVDEIDRKYKMLKDRLWKVLRKSVDLATTLVSSIDMVFNKELICRELLLYHRTFGFEQQCVKDILKDDYIRQKLNASSIIEIQPANEAMHTFAKTELEKLRTSDLFVPFESEVSEWSAGGDTFKLLIQVLNGCRDDAKLVYSHLKSVDD